MREFQELKRRVSRCVPSDPKQLASFCGESSAPQRVARVAETWAWGWDLAALATVVCEGTGGAGCGRRRLMRSVAAARPFLPRVFAGGLEPATVEG